jgi:hypothetical protein
MYFKDKADKITINLIEYKIKKKNGKSEQFYNYTNKKFNFIKKMDSLNSKNINWNSLEYIFKNTLMKYTDFERKDWYEKELFKLVTYKKFRILCEELSLLYHNLYSEISKKDSTKNNWNNNIKVNYTDNKKYIYFKKNIKFIQKVNIYKKKSKIIIIGDFHSSFHSLYEILKLNRDFFINDESLKLKDNRYIIFLGDIVDRGPYSIELLYIIFILKIINFDNIFIIAGNHEDQKTYNRYGFYEEIKNQFGPSVKGFNMNEPIKGRKSFSFERIFWYMPDCIYLNFQGNIYHLSHGSVVHDLDSELTEFLDNNNRKKFMYIPDNKGINYKWGDFDYTVDYHQLNKERAKNNTKSKIKKYGIKYVKEYMNKFNITMCITGHQDKTPIAFLLDSKEHKDYKLFSKCKDELKFCPSKYNLHTLKEYNRENINNQTIKQFEVNVEDKKILALVTSTA